MVRGTPPLDYTNPFKTEANTSSLDISRVFQHLEKNRNSEEETSLETFLPLPNLKLTEFSNRFTVTAEQDKRNYEEYVFSLKCGSRIYRYYRQLRKTIPGISSGMTTHFQQMLKK